MLSRNWSFLCSKEKQRRYLNCIVFWFSFNSCGAHLSSFFYLPIRFKCLETVPILTSSSCASSGTVVRGLSSTSITQLGRPCSSLSRFVLLDSNFLNHLAQTMYRVLRWDQVWIRRRKYRTLLFLSHCIAVLSILVISYDNEYCNNPYSFRACAVASFFKTQIATLDFQLLVTIFTSKVLLNMDFTSFTVIPHHILTIH